MGETKSVFTLVSPQTWMRNKHLHPKPRYLVTKWRNDQLVGGIPTPLNNMKVSWDDDCSQYGKIKHVPNHQREQFTPDCFAQELASSASLKRCSLVAESASPHSKARSALHPCWFISNSEQSFAQTAT